MIVRFKVQARSIFMVGCWLDVRTFDTREEAESYVRVYSPMSMFAYRVVWERNPNRRRAA